MTFLIDLIVGLLTIALISGVGYVLILIPFNISINFLIGAVIICFASHVGEAIRCAISCWDIEKKLEKAAKKQFEDKKKSIRT